MKKWMIFPVLLLLLLTACQTVLDSKTEPAGSTPPSSSITPPSSSVVPSASTPATSTPATSVPAVDVHDGRAFIYYGPQFVVLSPDWRPTEALANHLYWVVRSTKEYTLICDEPVIDYTATDTHVYFVKESEPTKIYRTPIGDFVNHQLVYESSYGKVSYMIVISNSTEFLQFVADEKKFVMLDMSTGECTVLMEQYYINNAYMEGTGDGETWNNWIWFQGKPSESDPPDRQYFYYRDTGEIEVDNSL